MTFFPLFSFIDFHLVMLCMICHTQIKFFCSAPPRTRLSFYPIKCVQKKGQSNIDKKITYNTQIVYEWVCLHSDCLCVNDEMKRRKKMNSEEN